MSRAQWMKSSGLFIGMVISIMLISGFVNLGEIPDRKIQGSGPVDFSVFLPQRPETLDFAGEPVPLENFDTWENLDRELLVNTYWHSQTIQLIKRAHRFFPVIEEILKKNNIPVDFKYVPLAESGLMNVVSPAGAVGYWQFMTATAREFGLEVSAEVDERYHLEKSTEAACDYIKDAYDKFGSWTLVAATFNMGKRGIKEQMELQKENNYYDLLLGEETERYVFRLLALKMIVSQPEKYGFRLSEKDMYPVIDTYSLEVDTSVRNFTDFANHFNINYKMLKYFNPWLRKPYLHNPGHKAYRITILSPGARTMKYVEDDKEEPTEGR